MVVRDILYLTTNFGGHAENKKLVDKLNAVRLSPYLGEAISLSLVDTKTFINERRKQNSDISDVVPMKLHPTVVQKITYLYGMYSGHVNEDKLRAGLFELDLTPYERKTGEAVLVLTSDYIKTIQGIQK